jgi:single-strand DNA-binding protein
MTRNQVTLVGRLGADAAITTFENGSMVARFQLAVESAKKDTPIFYRLFAWGNTAAFVNNYCRKGSKLAISGRLVNRTYVDPEGSPKKITEVEVRQVVKF